MGANWSNLGIAFRFHSAYNQAKENAETLQNSKKTSNNCRKSIDISEITEYTISRTSVRYAKTERGIQMTSNEMELIKLIRENDNPAQALMTAIIIVQGYLKQHESSVEQAPACLRESS